jgi:hypothetical protein
MVTDWGWKLPQALASRRVPRDRERQSGQSPLSVTDIATKNWVRSANLLPSIVLLAVMHDIGELLGNISACLRRGLNGGDYFPIAAAV